MKNNIQKIIDKFDEKFVCYSMKNNGKAKLIYNELEAVKPLKKFLKDSLTSILNNIKKELPEKTSQEIIDKEIYCVALRLQGANKYRQEVINIINSYR